MNARELCIKTGLSNIAYWKPELIKAGHTRKTATGQIDYLESAVDWLKNRPVKKPGPKNENRLEQLEQAVEKYIGEKPQAVFKRNNIRPKGYFYIMSDYREVFMGLNFKTALKNITYISSL